MSDEQYDDAVQRTRAGHPKTDSWSMGVRRSGAMPGDVVFLLRQHSERGVVASGTIASEIYESDHWDGQGGTASYVDVQWDYWLPLDERIGVEELLARVPGVAWNRLQGSGVMVAELDGATLIDLWRDHLASLPVVTKPRATHFRILDSNSAELEADFSVRRLEAGNELLTIESRGPGRNTHYVPALRSALGRATDAGWSVVDAFLASATVDGRSEDDRRIGDMTSYPRNGDGATLADSLRREAAQMHREPGANGAGNATKRLEIALRHTELGRSLLDDIRWSRVAPALPQWADEEVIVQMKIGEAAAADPSRRTEGLRRHARTQNALLRAVLDAGGKLVSLTANVDLAWRMPNDPTLYVAEVKGCTPHNEAGQMRLGLGQVTDFAVEATHETGLTAQAILFLSDRPTLPRWTIKAERAAVELAWLGKLPEVLSADG